MLQNLSALLYRQVKPRNILALLALLVVFMAVILPWCEKKIDPSGTVGVLDLRFGFSVDEAYRTLDVQGETGRHFYLITEAVVDVVYPITYSIFYALLLSWLIAKSLPVGNRWRMLNVLTIIAAFFDFIENGGIIGMLMTYPDRQPALATIASVGGIIKWIFAIAGLLLIVVFFVAWLLKKTPRKPLTA